MSDTPKVQELWGVVRLQAEGSDWARECGEPLEAWAKRRLVRCNVLERQNAELLSILTAIVDWCDKNPPSGEALYCIQQAREAIRRAEG